MYAGVAQLVEYKLPKLGVASSNLVARSSSVIEIWVVFFFCDAIPPTPRGSGYEVGYARFFLCLMFSAYK